jgi:hypothetical protein
VSWFERQFAFSAKLLNLRAFDIVVLLETFNEPWRYVLTELQQFQTDTSRQMLSAESMESCRLILLRPIFLLQIRLKQTRYFQNNNSLGIDLRAYVQADQC